MALGLWAYGDGSGNRKSLYNVLSSHVTTPDTWVGLNAAWNEVINRNGLSELHSVDLFTRSLASPKSSNPYRNWTSVEVKKFIDDLANAVYPFRKELRSFAYVVNTEDFKSFSLRERRFLTGGFFKRKSGKWLLSGKPSEPYMVVMNAMLNQLIRESESELKIHFVFDPHDSDGFSRALLNAVVDRNLWGQLGNSPTWTAAHSHENTGIQMADLTAYLMNRFVQFGNDGGRVEEQYAWGMLHDAKFIYDMMTRSTMERILAVNTTKEQREWLRGGTN